MNLYLQYHNCDKEGLPFSGEFFQEGVLGIYTRRPHVQDAFQGRVFLIAGVGKPRRYFLWAAFRIDTVETNGKGVFTASGAGWQLAPPQELSGKPFDEFRASCAKFISFRCINDLSYARTLNYLAEMNRPPGNPEDLASFLKSIITLFPQERKAVEKALATHGVTMKALSVRQPHAEAIMRGIKKVEYRSGPTRVRGKILIYASHGRYPARDEAKLMKKYGIEDVACADLARGVLLGTVELHDCDGGDWYLRKPERATKLFAPKKQPQPVWFYPF